MKQEYKYEFEYNSKYKYNKQEIVNYILSKDYGTVISFEELGKLFNVNVTDPDELNRMTANMVTIKNILIDYGYILKAVIGIGYYILKPKQISGFVYHKYIRRTKTLLEKGDRILNHVDTTDLSDIRKQEYNEVKELNTAVQDNLDSTIYTSAYLYHKELYDNLLD